MEDTVTVLWRDPGIGSVKVTAIHNPAGCSGYVMHFIVVLESPKPVITRNGGILETREATGYQWLLDGVPLSGDTNRILTIKGPGIYTVTVIYANGCSGTSDPYSIITGIDNPGRISDDFHLYPDPNSGTFTVRFHLTKSSPVGILIHNMLGKEVLVFNEEQIVGAYSKYISMTDQPAGMYIVTVIAGGKIRTGKIVKW